MRIRHLLLATLLSTPASADMLTFWVAGQGQVLGGTGDAFAHLDAPLGGAQAGLEVLGVDLWGEAFAAGADQYLFSLNLGGDVSFGDATRFVAGLFTGPVLFQFERRPVEGVDEGALTAQQRALIETNVPGGMARITRALAKYEDEEADLRRRAVGWNVARLRLDLERAVAPLLFVGLSGQAGYHFILTGDDAAADIRDQAVDDVAAHYDLPREVRQTIREAVGAHEVEPETLDGFDYSLGAYVKFEL
jgi:hypothetical protein